MYLHLLFYMIFNYEAYLEIPIIGQDSLCHTDYDVFM